MMYVLSKDTANDPHFMNEGLVEAVLDILQGQSDRYMAASTSAAGLSPSAGGDHNFIIYLAGCLKNVSNDATNQRVMLHSQALPVISALMQSLAAATQQLQQAAARDVGSPEQQNGGGRSTSNTLEAMVQITVQVSGVLRNLAASPAHAGAFLEAGTFQVSSLAHYSLPGPNTGAIQLI